MYRGLFRWVLMRLQRWLIKCFIGKCGAFNGGELNEFSPIKGLMKYAKIAVGQACDGVCAEPIVSRIAFAWLSQTMFINGY